MTSEISTTTEKYTNTVVTRLPRANCRNLLQASDNLNNFDCPGTSYCLSSVCEQLLYRRTDLIDGRLDILLIKSLVNESDIQVLHETNQCLILTTYPVKPHKLPKLVFMSYCHKISSTHRPPTKN